MTCPHCKDANAIFDPGWAESDLNAYRKNGPSKQTRLLLDVLKQHGVQDLTLLDIGGGVGAIQHELIAAGARAVTDVDASTAYIGAAQAEAQRRGYADRAQYHYGDFVDLAPDIDPADIVTLDRVICCYPHVEQLVRLSSERARRLYGVIYPRDTWLTRLFMPLMNFFLFRLQGSAFRNYIHSTQVINSVVQSNGLTKIFNRNMGLWRVVVYGRGQPA